MTFDNAYNKFKLITDLSDAELLKWIPVLKEAVLYIESLVKKANLTEVDNIRLDNAAAIYAYYRYVNYSTGDENSFTAGDLSVSKNNDRLKVAENMWEKELEMISDLVTTKFIFKRVT